MSIHGDERRCLCFDISSFWNSESSLKNSSSKTCSKIVFWGLRRRYTNIPRGVKNNTNRILIIWKIRDLVLLVTSRTTQTTRQNQTTKKYTMTHLIIMSGLSQVRSWELRIVFMKMIIEKILYRQIFLIEWDSNEVNSSQHCRKMTRQRILFYFLSLIPLFRGFFLPIFYEYFWIHWSRWRTNRGIRMADLLWTQRSIQRKRSCKISTSCKNNLARKKTQRNTGFIIDKKKYKWQNKTSSGDRQMNERCHNGTTWRTFTLHIGDASKTPCRIKLRRKTLSRNNSRIRSY